MPPQTNGSILFAMRRQCAFATDTLPKYGDFSVFKMADVRHLAFYISKFFSVDRLTGIKLHIMSIRRTAAEMCRFNGFFQNSGRSLSLIVLAKV